MNNLQPYLVPYLISQVAAVVFVMVAYQSTKITRLLFAVTFLSASAVNLNLGLTNPDAYLTYADMALPFYSHFIRGWFRHYHHVIVPLIAVGQLLIGAGMLLNGRWVRLACFGAILFLIGITPLMAGSAFPFPLLVSWAAWVVIKKDEKQLFWTPIHQSNSTSARKRAGLSPGATLSWITWMFVAIAAATGLFAPGIYRDNTFVQTVWEANDWVTFLLVFPALFFVLLAKKTVRIRLVWAGLMAYLIYNYAFYLFGAAFNADFLIYVGIVASAIWSLVDVLRNLPVHQMQFTSPYDRLIAGYLFLIAAMLLAIEVPPAVGFSFTGIMPDIIVKSNHPTSVVYALDLTLVFPALTVAGYWLWQRRQWGFVLAALMLLKAATYGLVLCSGTILLMLRNAGNDPLLPFYLFITTGGFAGLVVLLRSLKLTSETETNNGAVTIVAAGSYRQLNN